MKIFKIFQKVFKNFFESILTPQVDDVSLGPFERAKSLDYGLNCKSAEPDHFNLKGLPEDFKKKVELLLRADHEDEGGLFNLFTKILRNF